MITETFSIEAAHQSTNCASLLKHLGVFAFDLEKMTVDETVPSRSELNEDT
jgi:hypothetical protein